MNISYDSVSSDSIPYHGKANLQHKESKTEVFVIPKSSASNKLSNGTFAQMDNKF